MKKIEKLGRYVITKELGQGSTGVVYLCHDPFHGRDVALKLYHSDKDLPEQQRRLRRKFFFNEAHLAGMLEHPNILPIYDAGEEDGRCYVVMEYVRGAEPLTTFCRPENLLPIRKVVEIVFKCAKALDYAHRKGVVHRDIKPGNILITSDGDVRIVDFGIALTAVNEHTPVGGLVGSPSYMAPEQVREDKATNQTDIYSLGVVMYELLTGKRPFYGDNLSRLVHQIVYATPVPIHKLRRQVPPLLEEIVYKAMEKDLKKRYKTALEFSADLTRAFHHLGKLEQEVAEQERFNMIKHLSFFRDFSYPEIWEVLNASEWRTHPEGSTIITEGEIDDSFFIIVSGEVIVKKGGKILGRLKEGDCFGEMGFISKAERTATVVSKGGVTVMRVNATLLEQASLPCQLRFHKVFLRALIERLTRTSEMNVNKE
ncbi:MAG TPA: serine/threonine-protein kinase [Gammaproteobacteria bacterium]|nr:serine/threonine-protein kinase [Gammaproteobacteria bacterium]